jgi:peptidoglycan/LPS O-acetylase OafA/YrhL
MSDDDAASDDLDGIDVITSVLIGDVAEPPVSEMTPYQRIDFLDGLRGAMCVVVIIFNALEPLFATSPRLASTLGQYVLNGHRAVDVFWAVSGYALALIDTRERAALATIGRLPRLMLPVMFIGCVVSTVSFVTELEPLGFLRTQYRLMNCFLRGHNGGSNFDNVCGSSFTHIWTMSTAFYGSILLFVCHHLLSHTPRPERVAFAIAVITLYVRPNLNFFLIGYVTRYRKHCFEGSDHAPLISAAAAVVFVVTQYASPLSGSGSVAGSVSGKAVGRSLARYLGVISAFVCVLATPRVERIFTNAVARFVGRYSFELYISHYPILKMLQKWPWLVQFNPAFLVAVLLVATFAWSLLIQRHVNAATLRLSKWIAKTAF